MKIEETTLNNGLRVIFVDTKVFPSLTTLLLVGAGSRYENEKNNGVAHFFEHMAFKGNKKYPTALQISTILDGLGSEHNAFTSKDYTGYWIKAPTKHFPTLIDILSAMILNPLLLEEEINREKGVIIEEINMYEDTPQYKVFDLFENLLFSDNPLGFDTVGKKETVSSFNRKTFVDYMQQLYHPKNAVLVVAGGLNQVQSSKFKVQSDNLKFKNEKTAAVLENNPSGTTAVNRYLEIIEKKFLSWKNGESAKFTPVKEKQTKPQILVNHKKTEQAHLVLGYRGVARKNPQSYAQSVLMSILGGGMSSRLFYELRERRGLCYYIHSGTEKFAETGCIYTRAGLNIDIKRIKEAIKLIIDEHEKISQKKLTDEEIKRAKEMIKGNLILSLEDSNNLANFVGKRLLLEEKLESAEVVMKKIDQVTKEEIIELAKKLIQKNKLNLAIIGPFSEEDLMGVV